MVLVHAPESEMQWMDQGNGVERLLVMHNDFILVGPGDDPAKLKGTVSAVDALKKLASAQVTFISRGDNSGTDQMEKSYWPLAGVSPSGQAWYLSAGLGMGEVLTMAAELQAYTLTDRGTFAAYRAKGGLQIEVAGDPRMFNPYSVISVNPAKYPDINYRGATELSDWITSPQGQQAIAAFRTDGEQLFFPDASDH